MSKILYRSTNGKSPMVGFKEVLLKGQAPDYGLYMPAVIPRLSENEIAEFGNLEYHEVAFRVMYKFLADEIENGILRNLCRDAYNFEVPIKRISSDLAILYLDRGPTASFKDFAARIMARLMFHFSQNEGRALVVLVATSGDTGGAIADAFLGMDSIRVIILFPEEEISDLQRRQMTCLGRNVTALAVKGKFDDCQAIVKQAFNDPAMAGLNLTSANSINFGRLLPQCAYYFYCYSRLERKPVNFSVPSGNFGNLMGGVLAREMGLPVEKFIVAVNKNDEFPRFLQTGEYRPVIPSRQCSSNAMNVGHPSNLARLVDLYGGWLYDERDSSGRIVRKGILARKPDMERMRKDFVSFSVTDAQADRTIIDFYSKYGVILEPHGAVGLNAALRAKLPGITVCLETADPAKFPEKIREVLGINPPIPASLIGLEQRKEYYETIRNEYDDFAHLVKKLV